jgi:predicted DNA-binding transcriptional regulator YafY
MSKKQFVKRYLLIINKLRQRPCSFEALASHLQQQSELDEENYELSLRTFQRDIKEIASIYNIEISYSRSEGTYEIIHDANDERSERIMESFELFHALNLSNHFAGQLIVEKRKPLGTENMYGLLHAIKNQFEVVFTHEKYWVEAAQKTNRRVQPLSLKEARNRWYLVGEDKGDHRIKTFGLDRITNLEITNTKCEYPSDFNAEAMFKNSFGIIRNEDMQPQQVILSFTPSEAKYIKSLPLHPSQRITKETDEETVFALYLFPTYDFVMELLSFGTEVKVLEPDGLRTEMKNKLAQALQQYDA